MYMAPEIGANLLASSQYDSQADMWSIGCVLYECINLEVGRSHNNKRRKKNVSSQPPFDERGLCRLFLQASSADGGYNSYKAPTLRVDAARPKFFDQLIDALLAINPTSRLKPKQLLEATRRMIVSALIETFLYSCVISGTQSRVATRNSVIAQPVAAPRKERE